MRRLHIIIGLLLSMPLLPACEQDITDTVMVYQADGSVQCEAFDKAQSLQAMQAELINGGIDVIAAHCGHDGLARTAVCGGTTGNLNIFIIPLQNQADAASLGFYALDNLPDAILLDCP
jgi:hypothetical protein